MVSRSAALALLVSSKSFSHPEFIATQDFIFFTQESHSGFIHSAVWQNRMHKNKLLKKGLLKQKEDGAFGHGHGVIKDNGVYQSANTHLPSEALEERIPFNGMFY